MPKLPRSTSSATSSMASGTIPSRPAKPHPDRLKIMHLFPDRPLWSAGGFPRKHRSAGPIDVLEDLFDELLQERLHAFPVPARINVKLVPIFPGHPDIHLHQIPLEERVLIPGGRSTGFADPRRDR